jgi:molybdopterin-guanine dinucleotide biosynthesis protein A
VDDTPGYPQGVMVSFAAIVLAGGRARRMGGAFKPLLAVGGVPMLHRVLGALREAGADPIVVVGPSELDIHIGWAWRTQEEPPEGGPVAAVAAGLALCDDADEVAVVGGDLPFLTAAALSRLRHGGDASVYVDDRRQPMVCLWRGAALKAALGTGARSMNGLLDAVRTQEVRWSGEGPPPWYDCDTPEALEEAQRWWR